MACAGIFCSYHNTGNLNCVGHRDPCGGNGPNINNVNVGNVITAGDIENIRAQIINQMNAWNTWLGAGVNQPNPAPYPVYDPGSITLVPALTIQQTHLHQLNADLAQVLNYSADGGQNPNSPIAPVVTLPRSVTTGSVVQDPNQSGVIVGDAIQAAQWNAIINSYNVVRQNCICNADCHCNAVCACFNDCGCNYSDERLKENIKLIGQKFGLNIYEFNYIGDATKTFIGAMAQELLNSAWAGAVSQDADGYYQVNYSKLPIDMKLVG